ncbi:MAG: glycerol-3-phosphate dehydrogenase subunit GlpB [Deltaproteobacteria bacterium]|nr:glycerol-3-phosphate dehydrogenase subunit GlpB [Deltaproteobacteria bacterium]
MAEGASIECDLVVVGRGMAGMAATLFAANRGISTVQVGMIGEIIFASGCLDLLAFPSPETEAPLDDPWAAIDLLSQEMPEHPYTRMKREEIKAALDEIVSFLNAQGLPYINQPGQNVEMITPLGTVKQTYYAPESMGEGIEALREKAPCLLIDFHGLTDFSATQMAATLTDVWPNIRSARVSFPGNAENRELIPGDIMAETMELSKNRAELAQAVKPLVGNARVVGVPAVMGMKGTREILSDIKNQIGVPVFEIPTFPVSVPGLRLNETFAHGLLKKGVKRLLQTRVLRADPSNDGTFVLHTGKSEPEMTLHTRGVILATGRFWSRGLVADRNGIREPLLNLPVHQPEKRDQWHRERFLDLRGHPVNRAGVETDALFRPLSETGEPGFERLFAVGAILAHQDWKRMKCGSGLAISTAYKAVEAFSKMG